MSQGHGYLGPLQWQTPHKDQVFGGWVAWGLVIPSQWASNATMPWGLPGPRQLFCDWQRRKVVWDVMPVWFRKYKRVCFSFPWTSLTASPDNCPYEEAICVLSRDNPLSYPLPHQGRATDGRDWAKSAFCRLIWYNAWLCTQSSVGLQLWDDHLQSSDWLVMV